jgi:hypothetical protein
MSQALGRNFPSHTLMAPCDRVLGTTHTHTTPIQKPQIRTDSTPKRRPEAPVTTQPQTLDNPPHYTKRSMQGPPPIRKAVLFRAQFSRLRHVRLPILAPWNPFLLPPRPVLTVTASARLGIRVVPCHSTCTTRLPPFRLLICLQLRASCHRPVRLRV